MKRKFLGKGQYILIILLISVTVISVGFSAWEFASDGTVQNVIGSIFADKVADSKDYVTCDIGRFSYHNNGFLDGSGNLTNTASMTATFTINLAACRSIFEEYDSLLLIVKLKYADSVNTSAAGFFNMLNNATGYTISHSKTNPSSRITDESSATGNTGEYYYQLTLRLGDILKSGTGNSYTFAITYAFTITDANFGTFFNTNLYPLLHDNEDSLLVGYRLEGVD